MTGAPSNGSGEFPMPVRRFLAQAEFHLQRGDVVLCKGRASLYSWAIRRWTRSEFNHAAMVFTVPSVEEGFEHTFLIEAGTSGVDLTDLKHYAVDLSGVYDIAIKRCERPWMTVDVQRVGTYAELHQGELRYFKAVARGVAVQQRDLRLERGIGASTRRSSADALEQTPPSRFLCSGFVQYGHQRRRMVADGRLYEDALEEIVFAAWRGRGCDGDPATTPEDGAVRQARLALCDQAGPRPPGGELRGGENDLRARHSAAGLPAAITSQCSRSGDALPARDDTACVERAPMSPMTRPLCYVVYAYWFVFWLLNGMDKFMHGTSVSLGWGPLFTWFGKYRGEQFTKYFDRMELPHDGIAPLLGACGAFELGVAVLFGVALVSRQRFEQWSGAALRPAP
jgi:hypothetical protein